MTNLLERLLDLQKLSLADEAVRLGFERPFPAWAWVLIVAGALAVALLSYWRMSGPMIARAALGVVRGLILILIALLISGPQLVKGTETVERDWVLVLIDRSASLTLADVTPPSGAQRITREASLEQAMVSAWPKWAQVAKDREVIWLGFDRGAFDLERESEGEIKLSEPAGRTTAIGASLEQALARASARPMSAVVIVSDGRSVDSPSRAVLRRLQADRIPVHTVALGSRDPIGDIAVARIDGPRSAFVGDVTPIRVEVSRAGSGAPSGATVRLIDSATRMVLDERRVEPDALSDATGGRTEVVLVNRPTVPGRENWIVEVTPDGADLVAGNNAGEIGVELVDRPMRVLYVDGYPRWEQRYLRNLLLREKSVVSSAVMLAPDRAYTQEGDIVLDEMPDSAERWAEFDAIILGDVRPDMFTRDQLEQLRDHIAERGAGLLWIGGESETPAAWWDTPLAELIPFTRAASDVVPLAEPFLMAPGPAADRLGVLRLGVKTDEWWPPELSDPATGWATLYWGQRITPDQLKPTAEVIADAVGAYSAESTPLVLTMRYGAGRVAYVATDELWRFRFGQGDSLYERFWVPLIRMLGRESLARTGASALLTVSARQVVVENPVRIAVELIDQSLLDRELRTIDVRVEHQGEPTDSSADSQVLTLRRSSPNSRVYEGNWTPPDPGIWKIAALGQELGEPLVSQIEVVLPKDELRHPEADHEALERLSEETQGLHVSVADFESVTEHLPNRQLRVLNETTESLWDTPLALLAVLILLTGEWVGRRVIRLV